MSLKALLPNTLLLLGALFSGAIMAQEGGHGSSDTLVPTTHEVAGHETAEHGSAHGPEKFNAGKLIMEHIGDAHSWHLWGHTSLPLPIILYTDKGVEFFSSGKLMDEHHQPMAHQGEHYTYLLEHEKIHAVNADGTVNEEARVTDLSLTKNAMTLIAACVLLLVVFIGMARGYAQRGVSAPKGLAKFLEPVILFVRDDIAKSAIGEKHYRRFLPYLLTLFFFIWSLNLIGLIPIFPFGANVTGNIVTPLVLATITFLIVTFVANWHYWRHMLAMPGIPIPVLIILTPIEIMGHFIRPIVLMVRLFANIMAGHIVLLVFFCLIFIFSKNGESVIGGFATSPFALAFTIFINCLELLVGALQAYVFTLLTSIYIGTAVAGGHDDHHH